MGRKSRAKHEKRIKKEAARNLPEIPAVTEERRISVDRIGRSFLMPDGQTCILRYVTEAGADLTGMFTAARRRLTQAEMMVLAAVEASDDGCRWVVGLRNPPVLRRPPFINRDRISREMLTINMQERHLKCEMNLQQLQEARKLKFNVLRRHHADVSMNYTVINNLKRKRHHTGCHFHVPHFPTI